MNNNYTNLLRNGGNARTMIFNTVGATAPFGQAMMTASEVYTLLGVIGSDKFCNYFCGENLVRGGIRRIDIPMLVDGVLMTKETAKAKGYAREWENSFSECQGHWTELLEKALNIMLRQFNKASLEVRDVYGCSLSRVVVSPKTATIAEKLAIAGEIEAFRMEYLH